MDYTSSLKPWRKPLKVGLVGATGMVGETFIHLLEENHFSISELRPFASEKSVGLKLELAGKEWPVQVLKPGCFAGLDMVFFSSGDEISKEWAPEAVKAGAFAIDNSNAFRMDQEINLIVPEVNGKIHQDVKPQIIANPNCSTIQLVVALQPLKEKFGIEEVTVASYQAVSGAGLPGYEELLQQTQNYQEADHENKTFPKQILFNCIPQIGSATEDGYYTEEVKIMNETRKIMELPDLKISAFTVRIPALNAHSEAVWVTLKTEATKSQVLQALSEADGLVLTEEDDYPTAAEVSGADPVFVGRVHQDRFNSRRWLMWVVSDNIKKGAALNGLQIAERIFS